MTFTIRNIKTRSLLWFPVLKKSFPIWLSDCHWPMRSVRLFRNIIRIMIFLPMPWLYLKIICIINAGLGILLENPAEKIFYSPNYYVRPSAESVPYEISSSGLRTPAYDTSHYHPNSNAHYAWGYQIYAWLKYTLTLI